MVNGGLKVDNRTWEILTAAFLILLLGVESTFATTIIVDENGADRDRGEDGSVREKYGSIREALAVAGPGDTILVYPGKYRENINVSKSVSIRSASGNPGDTLIEAADPEDHVFTVTADSVSISGFTVGGARARDIENPFEDSRAGIFLKGSSNSTLSGNRLLENNMGIMLSRSTGNRILGNTAISNELGGITLVASGGNLLADNTASKNSFSESPDNAKDGKARKIPRELKLLGQGIALYDSDGNTLLNNRASSNKLSGIGLWASDGNTLNHNRLTDQHSGIGLIDSDSNTLDSNLADNNDFCGILVKMGSDNNLLENNIASNGNAGISLDESSGNKLYKNTMSSNGQAGLYLWHCGYNELRDNTVKDNNIGIFDNTDRDTDLIPEIMKYNTVENNTQTTGVPPYKDPGLLIRILAILIFILYEKFRGKGPEEAGDERETGE